MAGPRPYVTRDLWGLVLNCLKRDYGVRILHTTQTILPHTLLQKQMALATRLGRQNTHRRHTPYTQGRILELGNISQLLHNRLLGMNCMSAIPTALAPVSSTIESGCNNLSSLDNHSHVQKGIMPSRVLATILGRVLVNGPLEKSSRHIERVQL